MRSPFRASPPLVGLALIGAASSAQAEVVFSNFGAAIPFQESGRIVLGEDEVSIGNVDQAAQFTVGGSDYRLTRITLGIGSVQGAGPVSIGLYSDSASLPNSLLASDVVNVGASNSSGNTIEGIFGGTLLLSKNTSYWVVMDAQDGFDGSWRWNSIGDVGLTAGRSGNPVAAWSNRPNDDRYAMIVEGRPVPEPASMMALGLGAAALVRRRRR